WEYAESSVASLFGEITGAPLVDTLLAALKAHPDGLTKSEIFTGVFQSNYRADEIDRAVNTLLAHGAIALDSIPAQGRGRPKQVLKISPRYVLNVKNVLNPGKYVSVAKDAVKRFREANVLNRDGVRINSADSDREELDL